jgi:hypothetical protein
MVWTSDNAWDVLNDETADKVLIVIDDDPVMLGLADELRKTHSNGKLRLLRCKNGEAVPKDHKSALTWARARTTQYAQNSAAPVPLAGSLVSGNSSESGAAEPISQGVVKISHPPMNSTAPVPSDLPALSLAGPDAPDAVEPLETPPAHDFPPEASEAKPNARTHPDGSYAAAGVKKTAALPLNWPELEERGEPPPRRWAIKGWLGFGHVTLIVGSGGIGKTLISQQLGSALALGREFLGEVERRQNVLMWACEDDHDELWRRQISIAAWLGVKLGAFEECLTIEPRAGLDNALVATDFGKLCWTPLIETLREQAEDLRSDIVILDNVAQLYQGNENQRGAVTTFMNGLVGALPGRAILLLAHPSRGLNSEFSGSSAWENCARTRLYLGSKLPDQPAEDDETDDNTRYLARRKANYSSKDYCRFRFEDGVLKPDGAPAGGIIDTVRRDTAVRVVTAALSKLATKGVRVTDGKTSPSYLPRVILDYKLGENYSKRELGEAMRTAIIDGTITRGVVGKYGSNRAPMEGLMLP